MEITIHLLSNDRCSDNRNSTLNSKNNFGENERSISNGISVDGQYANLCGTMKIRLLSGIYKNLVVEYCKFIGFLDCCQFSYMITHPREKSVLIDPPYDLHEIL
uniref:Uncharacterized protein n=1 Tax=Romanomermis culicivorax TaxID=13658 RepID=A0A915I748_ROMCU